MLLDAGSQIDNKNEDGETALHVASENGQTKYVYYNCVCVCMNMCICDCIYGNVFIYLFVFICIYV